MRNLKCIRNTWISFPETSLPLTASAWDADSDALICAFGPTEVEAVIELRRFDKDAFKYEDGRLIASWDAPCPNPDLKCDKILSVKYLAETQTVCLILAGGDLVLVRENALPGEDLIEIVGSVDVGITAAVWSPDDELVAITTGADTLIVMTRQFGSTANVAFTPEDVKVSAHVSVGWGKKETQFHGKRAKALKDPTMPDQIDEGTLSPFDDGATSISWRGDGAYLAINRVDEVEGLRRRMIRFFSREGVLDSVSEPVNGLESALSWRPAGNLIAGIQHHEDRVDVVFFERNGLRHGQFPLRLGRSSRPHWTRHVRLAWNVDSTVLAVSFQDRVQLWTMGNYHYYVKQEILLTSPDSPIDALWHPERPLSLVAFGSGDLRRASYHLAPATGPTNPPHDLGLCMVIDGQTIKLTAMRMGNVPPPMSMTEIQLDDTALDVCTNHDCSQVAVLHHTSISVFGLNLSDTGERMHSLSRKLTLDPQLRDECCVSRIVMTDGQHVCVFLSSKDSATHRIAALEQDSETKVYNIQSQNGDLALGASAPFDKLLCLCREVGQVTPVAKTFDPASGLLSTLTDFPAQTPTVQYWEEGDCRLVFGMTTGGTLYARSISRDGLTSEDRLQVKGVTSYLVTQAHLLFTTTSHLVKFVHLHDGPLEVPLDEPEKDERCRSVERGARLVTVMPSTYALVLQMPRGNLETIYPRALVLAGIRKAILTKDYRKAFFACRNHRVDMNILHDYAPDQFMTNVPLFITQIKKAVHLDLFLSQLRDEDVTQTLYKETLYAAHAHPSTTNGISPTTTSTEKSKINHISSAFLTALSQTTHLQTLLTAHSIRQPPDLPSALRLISSLCSTSPASVDKAVEHLTFLTNPDRLYDAALAIYDLDVALLVAQQGQRDPRDYLPYLQGLQGMGEERRKFTLDHDGKRYAKALGWLYQCGTWEEVLGYVGKWELYAEAVELVKYDKGRLAEVMRLYADWLVGRNRFRDAAVAYEFLGVHGEASDAYKAAGMWREALSCALLAGWEVKEVDDLARALAEGLVESKEWADAARIYADHLDDAENAGSCYCKAHLYSEAISVAVRKGKAELLSSVVDAGLAEGFASMSEMLAEMRSQVQAQTSRLKELRVKKAQDPLSFFDQAPSGNNPDIPDDVSIAPSEVTTSAGTFLTRYTNRTTSTLATNTTRRSSKNRRREERKKARGKKGSVYEEEYLVASIGRLVERLNSIGEDVRRLVEGCFRRGMRERAVAVQKQIVELEALLRECLPEVYEVDAEKDKQNQAEVNGMPAVNGEAPQPERTVPIVKKFEGLSLLS